jgi:hypothetical protein
MILIIRKQKKKKKKGGMMIGGYRRVRRWKEIGSEKASRAKQ